MKEIKKVKLKRTLYFYEGIDDVLEDNPKNVYDKDVRLGKEYTMLRKGSVLCVHKWKDWTSENTSENDERIVCVPQKNDCYILFEDMKEFEACSWFEEVQ